MRKYLFLMVCSIMTVACGKFGNHFLLDVTEVDYLDRSEFEMEGKDTGIEVIGIDDIMYCDSVLVALTQDSEELFKVYNMKTCTEVAGFGYLGRAKNEFNAPQFLSSIQYKRNGSTIIPIVDNKNLIVEMDFTKSVRQSTVVLDRSEMFRIDGISEGSMSIVDDDISKVFFASRVTQDYVLKKWNVPTFSIISKGKTQQIPVYSKVKKTKEENYIVAMYSGLLYKHPSKNLYAYPLESRDYILYFDLDNDSRFAIHQQGATTFDDKYPKYDYEYGRMTFVNSLPTNDFIITNYCGGSFYKDGVSDGHYYTEFVLFDWEGNYLCGIKIKLNICRCAYDEVNKILYGVDLVTEKLYAFDFKPIVEYINDKRAL